MDFDIKEISISKIIVPPIYIRRKQPPINKLSDSIKKAGLAYPIIVDKNMVLIDGLRRLNALKKLKRRRTKVIIRDINNGDKLEYQLMIDIHKKKLNPIEKAKALKNYIDQKDISIREAGRRLGIGKSSIQDSISLLELPKYVQNEIFIGKIKPYKALEISRRKIKSLSFSQKSSEIQYRCLLNRLTSIKKLLSKADLSKEQLNILKRHIDDLKLLVKE